MRKLFILFFIPLTIHCIGQTTQQKPTTKKPTTTQKKTTTKDVDKSISEAIAHAEHINDNGWMVTTMMGMAWWVQVYDDFSSIVKSDSLWDFYSGDITSSIVNNQLNIHFNDIGRLRVPLKFPAPALKLSDGYDFEIKTIVDKKSNALYEGVIFDFKDNNNYRSITFSIKLKMLVYEKVDNGITTEDDEAHNIYLVEDADNELRLIKNDGKLKVFFNGVEGYEIKNANISENNFGLIAGGTEAMNDAYFKSFFVEIGIQTSNAGFKNTSKLNTIKLKSNYGVFSVPVELNGVLKIDFIFDSGASDISISPDIALTLLKAGTIKKEDWLPGAYYSFADGSTAKSERFKLHSVKIGNKVIKNAVCSISNSINSPMLLGQSVLSKFGKYTFDNNQKTLTIE